MIRNENQRMCHSKKRSSSRRVRKMMKCIWFGDRVNEAVDSSESLETRDYSVTASGFSSRAGETEKKVDTSNIEEAESSLRDSGYLNYEMVNYMEGMSESVLASLAEKKTSAKSHYSLPDGWVVEEVPRRCSSIYGAHTDKYYYEPGSGVKFRSLITAQKHAAESNEEKPLSALVAEIKDSNMSLAKVFKLPQSFKASYLKKPTRNGEQLPEKVEWVLDSFQENAWKPFVCDRAVPDPLIHEWRERFLQAMHPAT